MIFVVLGTQKFQLSRLLKLLDNYVGEGVLTDRVVAQIGFTPYEPKNFEFHRFFDKEKFDEMMEKADLIICHAGVGTIITANRMGKPVIVFPRLSQFREHVDDHQLDVARVFSEKDYVLCCGKEDDLLELIEKSKSFQFRKYLPKSQNMIKIITDFLENN